MNILILNWKDIKNPDRGGAEVIAFELARKLAREGNKVYFFSRGFRGSLKEEIIDNVNIIRRGNSLTVYLHAYFYYRKHGKNFDRIIDMINTIGWQTPLYVPKSKRIAYLNQLAKEVFFYELPWPLSRIAYLLEGAQYLSYKNTVFLCYSYSTKQDLISFGIKEKNVLLFPIGIDHLRYTKKSKKSYHPLFIFVARLVRMKRADVCIKALSQVVRRHKNTELAIVGNGPEEEKLKTLARNLGVLRNISFVNKNNFFVDKVKKDIKVELMRRAWALLFPSVKEGWGLAITEAGACGTLSIVSNVTGLRDSVNRESGIILSTYPSEDELAKAMIHIIENQKIRKKLSEGALKLSRKFTSERCYEEFSRYLFKINHEK